MRAWERGRGWTGKQLANFCFLVLTLFKKAKKWGGGTWLAQLAEHVTLELRILSSSPMLGIDMDLKLKSLKNFFQIKKKMLKGAMS